MKSDLRPLDERLGHVAKARRRRLKARNSRPWRRGFWRSRRTFKEGVDDGQAAECSAVLHVLGEQRVAARFLRRGYDQRVVEGDVVVAGERPAALLIATVKGSAGSNALLTSARTSSNVAPTPPQLLAQNIRQFVQNLHADRAACRDEVLRDFRLYTGLLRMDQDVRIQECAHRSFASSRSNL